MGGKKKKTALPFSMKTPKATHCCSHVSTQKRKINNQKEKKNKFSFVSTGHWFNSLFTQKKKMGWGCEEKSLNCSHKTRHMFKKEKKKSEQHFVGFRMWSAVERPCSFSGVCHHHCTSLKTEPGGKRGHGFFLMFVLIETRLLIAGC